MKNRHKILPWLSIAALASCAPSKIVAPRIQKVDCTDNVGGASKSVWKKSSGVLTVEVENEAGSCTLADFDIEPAADAEESRFSIRGRHDPDSVANGRAILRVQAPDSSVSVRARYEHVVVVSSGTSIYPPKLLHSSGSGTVEVGPESLHNGYEFDHYNFSSEDLGSAGAWAAVKMAPAKHNKFASLSIDYSFNAGSQISFTWAIYAKGPCDQKP